MKLRAIPSGKSEDDDELMEVSTMTTADIISEGDCQLVRLPKEFHLDGNQVSVHRQGSSLILEPVLPDEWPPGFFDAIHIDDPTFVRPDQGQLPPAPKFDD